MYTEQFPKTINERILVTGTSAEQIPLHFHLNGDVEHTEPALLLALLQALPDIRSYGPGCLSLANVKFQGHVAVTEKRTEEEVLFEFDGTVVNRTYRAEITVSQRFFTLNSDQKLTCLQKVVNQPKLILLRILGKTPTEVINQN